MKIDHRLFHLSIPRLSATCTESLTPLLSLLPCGSHAGLGSVLNPHRLFDGEWTLLKIMLVKSKKGTLDVRLDIGSVVDPVRQSRLQGSLGSRGENTARYRESATDSWGPASSDFSMSGMYDRKLLKACPVANTARIELVVPTFSKEQFQIEPRATMITEQRGDVDLATWDVHGGAS